MTTSISPTTARPAASASTALPSTPATPVNAEYERQVEQLALKLGGTAQKDRFVADIKRVLRTIQSDFGYDSMPAYYFALHDNFRRVGRQYGVATEGKTVTELIALLTPKMTELDRRLSAKINRTDTRPLFPGYQLELHARASYLGLSNGRYEDFAADMLKRGMDPEKYETLHQDAVFRLEGNARSRTFSELEPAYLKAKARTGGVLAGLGRLLKGESFHEGGGFRGKGGGGGSFAP